MAHHKSAKKRIRSTERKRAINKTAVSKIRTLIKKVFEAENKVDAEGLYKEAVSFIDKNVAKGRLHRNTAARKKRALTVHVSGLAEAKAE